MLRTEQKSTQDQNIPMNNQMYAFDFDQTLTVKHTFKETSAFDKYGRVRELPTVSVQEKKLLLCCIPHTTIKTIQDQLDYRFTINDEQVRSNLRNPEDIRKIMSHIIANNGRVCILTKHNNPEWVKRNIRILLTGLPFANQINVYALHSGKHDEYCGNKLTAMRKIMQADSSIKKITLVDDDLNEIREILSFMSHEETCGLNNFDVVHADVGRNEYLTLLAEKIGYDLNADARHDVDNSNSPLLRR